MDLNHQLLNQKSLLLVLLVKIMNASIHETIHLKDACVLSH